MGITGGTGLPRPAGAALLEIVGISGIAHGTDTINLVIGSVAIRSRTAGIIPTGQDLFTMVALSISGAETSKIGKLTKIKSKRGLYFTIFTFLGAKNLFRPLKFRERLKIKDTVLQWRAVTLPQLKHLQITILIRFFECFLNLYDLHSVEITVKDKK